jgi:flagellar hook-basal body complex protein FliE
MRVDQSNLNLSLPEIQTERPVGSATGASGASSSMSEDFSAQVTSFIAQVDAQQTLAEKESVKLAAGGGNVHETALALEKADIEMRLLMKGRNKIIEAYQEIARMPV